MYFNIAKYFVKHFMREAKSHVSENAFLFKAPGSTRGLKPTTTTISSLKHHTLNVVKCKNSNFSKNYDCYNLKGLLVDLYCFLENSEINFI